MVPATPDDNTCVVDTGTVHIGSGDRAGGDELGCRTLTIGQMGLADLLADGDYDALPADHRAEAERDRHRDLDPKRDVLGSAIERLLVGDQRRNIGRRQIGGLVLHQQAQRFVGQIHVVAGIADGRGRDLRQRAVFCHLLVDLLHQDRERRVSPAVDLVVRDIFGHCRARIAENGVAGGLLLDDFLRGCGIGRESGELAVGQRAVQGISRGDRADQDQHDQPHPLLPVIRAVGETDRRTGEHQKASDPPCRRPIAVRRAI
jgi:hypothetical protein